MSDSPEARMLVPPLGLHFMPVMPNGKLRRELIPLEDPGWVPAPEASHMLPDDPVIIVPRDERSYVLPWWVFTKHHVANLVLEGRPILVTLCDRCTSAMAFDARVDGERRTFQVVGAWKGTHVIADHQTESIWTSFTGKCIWGFHRGAELEFLPILQASWGDWADKHPTSVVADGANESRHGHGEDRWPGSPEPPLGGFGPSDDRLPPTELVLGVEVGGAARAYPLQALERAGGVANDVVGNVAIVAFGGPSYCTGIAFGRRIGGQLLQFTRGDREWSDDETGSTWDVTGVATHGPLAGSRLPHVFSLVEEWSAWAAYHPGTDIAALEAVAL